MSWSTVATAVPLIFSALLAMYWVAIVIVMVNDGREPSKTLAWIMFLSITPFWGLIFYFFFGRNWKKKTAKSPWLKEMSAIADPWMARIRAPYAQDAEEARALTKSWGQDDLADLITCTDGATPMPAYDVRLLINGEATFDALKADLARAQESIHIQYFIWERDELTASICEILLERLKAGVEVRMLNDFIGCIWYRKDQLKELRDAGAQVTYDVAGLGKVNYRNHRKIVVIDGTIGYTGGINVGQEYIDGGPRFASWRDSHVTFSGPAVADLQKLFARRWHEVTRESLFTERYFPAYPQEGRRSLAQIVATGVEDKWESARRAHVVAMADAKSHIWIQSPYFVPTTDIYEGMVNAALGGIDVRFMMTGVPDKKIAWYAAETYFRPLIEAGGKVYLYDAGFMHAKTMTIDGRLLSIGTMNFDIRSLELHKELMAWFYDPELAEEHERQFEADMENCHLVTLEELDTRTHVQLLRNSAARLASDLL